MKKFIVLKNEETNDIQAIKKGWNWWAFLFTFWWGLFKKMWKATAMAFGIMMLLVIVSCIIGEFSEPLGGVLLLISQGWFYYMCGKKANEYYIEYLKSQGYKELGEYIAETPEKAAHMAMAQA